MRLLVYPHDLAIGGSQINAIDLAASVRAAGAEVIVYGVSGSLNSLIAEHGLEFIAAHRMKYRPAVPRILELKRIAEERSLDLIHAYEWPPCLDAYFGAHLLSGVSLLCTVLSMQPPTMVPATVPLVVGTERLAEAARQRHSAPVWTLEPPIDVVADNPDLDGAGFRRAHGIRPDQILLVTVSRLSLDLKIDALVRAIDAAGVLAQRFPVRLLVVGGGAAHDALAERARALNAAAGREVVTLTGPTLDPRRAYAAADVVLGMGSSALRALSVGRPVVVQGENGFSHIFGPHSTDIFLRQGFYGFGDREAGVMRLVAQLEELVSDPERRFRLGRFGRDFVVRRFSLERATRLQVKIYEEVLRVPREQAPMEPLRMISRALAQEVRSHNPLVKHGQAQLERRLLTAAAGGTWPPAA